MEKFVPLNKRSKKEQEKFHKSQRVTNGMNTGTRTHKSAKDYSRKWKKEDYE